jgi:4-amino-4-deoxy-L-arabinose transferase-like glycosyltransferase
MSSVESLAPTFRDGAGQRGWQAAVRNETAVVLALSLLTLGCLVPFVGKPFHIDDPLFVWCARQTLSHPLDFYGFTLNWEGQLASMATITQNPPLAAYFLGAVGWLLGWSEVALHAAFLLPAVAMVLGTFYVAKRLCSHPLAAAVIAVCSPVFILSSTSLMCDTMMLAFWVWAVFFWIEGLGRQSQARLCIAAVLITLSGLTKYFGICLIPLLLAYAALGRYRPRIWLGWVGVPVLALVLYQWWTHHLYGKGLLFSAVAYATNLRVGGALPAKVLAGLAFSGGCIILVLFATPLLWGGRGLAIAAGTGLLIALLLAVLKKAGEFPLTNDHGINWFYLIQLSLFSVGGLGVLFLAGADLLKHRNPASALLFLWTTGVFLFACAVNWTVSGRNILPMLPAVACLVVRRLDRDDSKDSRRLFRLAGPVILSLVVGLLAARADYVLAVSARDTAQLLNRELRPRAATVWFEGHWGFQYYMEQLGAKAVDRNALRFSKSDAIVVPLSNSYIFTLPSEIATPEFKQEVPTSRWLSTLNAECGAGYYSDGWGPLPFVFGRVPPDLYIVLRAK